MNWKDLFWRSVAIVILIAGAIAFPHRFMSVGAGFFAGAIFMEGLCEIQAAVKEHLRAFGKGETE